MDTIILDENGLPINQLKLDEQKPVSPLLVAFFKSAYEHDSYFKVMIDDLVNTLVTAVGTAMEDLELSNDRN